MSRTLLAVALSSVGLAAGCSNIAPSLPSDVPATVAGVPTERVALSQWLASAAFRSWTGDASARPPQQDSPHGSVRVFFNPTVEDSLRRDILPRPVGSVLVKEIYSGGSVDGHAVMLKVREGSSGDDWLFYEAFGNSTSTYNLGAGGCTGCHLRGRDFVRSTLP
jgi:hypothetical protein